jgi:hypothetical protein
MSLLKAIRKADIRGDWPRVLGCRIEKLPGLKPAKLNAMMMCRARKGASLSLSRSWSSGVHLSFDELRMNDSSGVLELFRSSPGRECRDPILAQTATATTSTSQNWILCTRGLKTR